jgi:hypothetical protein
MENLEIMCNERVGNGGWEQNVSYPYESQKLGGFA